MTNYMIKGYFKIELFTVFCKKEKLQSFYIFCIILNIK